MCFIIACCIAGDIETLKDTELNSPKKERNKFLLGWLYKWQVAMEVGRDRAALWPKPSAGTVKLSWASDAPVAAAAATSCCSCFCKKKERKEKEKEKPASHLVIQPTRKVATVQQWHKFFLLLLLLLFRVTLFTYAPLESWSAHGLHNNNDIIIRFGHYLLFTGDTHTVPYGSININ